ERLKFCAIFASNLDEFFQVRVGALKDQVAADVTTLGHDGRTPMMQLTEIAHRVDILTSRHESIVFDQLMPQLASVGISLCRWSEMSDHEQKAVTADFDARIFPVLTPLAVDPSHPFPYVSSLALSIGVFVCDTDTNEERFARIKVPTFLTRFVHVDDTRFITVEDVIVAHLDRLFPGMTIEGASTFRLTRNADLTLEEDEEADDLLQAVELELRRRRFGNAVRLEVESDIDPRMLAILLEELELEKTDVSYHLAPLDLTCLWQLHRLPRPDLKDTPWPPVTAGRLAVADQTSRSIFSVIRERDLLVHHPYESFASSTEDFIAQAAQDPRVQGIKMTLYRTSGDSPIAKSLIAAAERGVQVVALIELKARFDEAVNVTWAKALERAGVHVVYGMAGLKIHSKCVLVVRNDDDGIRRYAHIGTGNYNSKTARVYEDIGLFTCNPQISDDVSHLFNHLTGYSHDQGYKELIVAPKHFRQTMRRLIDNETRFGADGRITIKVNSIADVEIIEALYRASDAGVRIDLIVRGICCLCPGASSQSNIRVRSVVGRNLEHSRIYRFGHGGQDNQAAYFIGSADLMPRNLDKRIEVLAPVSHPKHQMWLDTTLSYLLADGVVAHEMGSSGEWHRVGPVHFIDDNDAQSRLYRWAADAQLRLGVPSTASPI
ncbi:MAG: polyphosphate kinase 1, partial [Ilumatobacteraceae bacterium]|nr:polyphosphate kinase 1 [Ilumatobacteraceae bacterium]